MSTGISGGALASSHQQKKEQHLRPLAPGLPRRPWSAAYGPGPSVFTLRGEHRSTDHASVSQAVARRGAPPLPAMSLGTCRCCRGKQNSRGEAGIFPRARGDGPGPGEDPLPEPFRTELPEGPRGLLQQNQDLVEFSADKGCFLKR